MKKLNNICDLCSCMVCKESLPEWKPAIEANRKTFEYKKGEQLFTEGNQVLGMYFVQKGSVKVHKRWGDDKELIIRFAKKGDIVGHRGLGSDNIYPVSATALEAVTVCYFDWAFFDASLKVNHELLYALMLFFAAELKVSERKMRNLAHMPVKARVAQALVILAEQFGLDKDGNINIILSRQDIASFAGTTYETVFRIINEFSETGLVAVTGKSIRPINLELLKTIVLQSQNPS